MRLRLALALLVLQKTARDDVSRPIRQNFGGLVRGRRLSRDVRSRCHLYRDMTRPLSAEPKSTIAEWLRTGAMTVSECPLVVHLSSRCSECSGSCPLRASCVEVNVDMAQSDIENDPDLADVKAVLKRLQKLAPQQDTGAGADVLKPPADPRAGAADPSRSEAEGLSIAPRAASAAPVALAQLSALRAAGDVPRPLPHEPPTIAPSTVVPPSRILRQGAIAAASIAVIAVGAAALLSPAGTPLLRSLVGALETSPAPAQTDGNTATDRTVTPPPAETARPSAAAIPTAEARLDPTIEAIQSLLPGPPDADQSNTGNALVAAVVRNAGQSLNAGLVTAARATLLQIADNESPDIAWMLARSFDPNVLATISSPDAAPDPIEAEFWYRVWHARAVYYGLVPDSVSIDRLIRALR